MSAPALRALAAANAAGVAVILDGDGLILDPMPEADLVAELKAVKPDLLRVLSGRVAARAIINTAEPPADCSPQRWVVARRGSALPRRAAGATKRRCSAGPSRSFTPSRRSGVASICAAPRCSSPIARLWRSPRRRSRLWASRGRISSSTAPRERASPRREGRRRKGRRRGRRRRSGRVVADNAACLQINIQALPRSRPLSPRAPSPRASRSRASPSMSSSVVPAWPARGSAQAGDARSPTTSAP